MKALALVDAPEHVCCRYRIEAFRAETAGELARHLETGLAVQGPCVIEVAC